jgi:TatD DNase family protein
VWFDAHIHLDVMATEALRGALWADPDYRAIIPGCDPVDVAEALARFEGDARLFVATAIHPWETGVTGTGATGHGGPDPWEPHLDPRWPLLEAQAADPRVVAVGECGLDFYRFTDTADRERVERYFTAQVELAVRVGKPLLIHCVRAHARVAELLERHGAARVGGMVHAFAGSLEEARRYARAGFFVSIGASVDREASRRVRAVAAALPASQLLIETDAPWMATRGKPGWAGTVDDLLDVGGAVAMLRGAPVDEVATLSRQNALRLLGQVG